MIFLCVSTAAPVLPNLSGARRESVPTTQSFGSCGARRSHRLKSASSKQNRLKPGWAASPVRFSAALPIRRRFQSMPVLGSIVIIVTSELNLIFCQLGCVSYLFEDFGLESYCLGKTEFTAKNVKHTQKPRQQTSARFALLAVKI